VQGRQGDIQRHYASDDLFTRIKAALVADGKDLSKLQPDDLAAVDEFHTRGRAATVDLARLLKLTAQDNVLDLGSGLGGPSRYLARNIGCRVTGIDLTPEFCATAEALAALVGMADAVTYRQANALEIPFSDRTFDVVWSQNVAMNIADRPRLYGEIHRVLIPGGRYGFTDVTAGPGGAPFYPQPWARMAEISHLRSPDETRRTIEAAGFSLTVFEDQTADAEARTKARLTAEAGPARTHVGLHLLLGDLWPEIQQNSLRNYREQRIGYVHGVAIKPSATAGKIG
jgi:MPBQ/MSBQ methyltransferase